MNIRISSIRFNADKNLTSFIKSRVNKLIQVYDSIIKAEVFLRLDKSHDLENKVAEIKVTMPGNQLFAKKQCKSFEEATDNAVDALRKQIKKHKEKSRVS